jgi:mevalonate kinase
MTIERTYPAKLLLFGEYTVLNGSQALAVPLRAWFGQWVHGPGQTDDDPAIIDYAGWLAKEQIISTNTMQAMVDDHRTGWRYAANIPIGYGLGSSGAFVAALYDRYVAGPGDASPMEIMARMEGYFHGTSSGMDPMVALTAMAAYKDEVGASHMIEDPGWPAGMHVYLLDSGIGRTTAPLVVTYKAMCEDPAFLKRVMHELRPMVELAIHAYLQQASDLLLQAISEIALFQRTHFQAMIPPAVRARWDALSALPGVRVKLCGAGGGGYFLVISDHALHAPDLIRIHPVSDPSDNHYPG